MVPYLRTGDVSSSCNQQDSPLLRLPAEIRNHIYEYALHEFELLEVNREGLVIKANWLWALPNVSRQLHKETARHIFRLNRFIFSTSLVPFHNRLTTPQRHAMTHVCVRIYTHGECSGLCWSRFTDAVYRRHFVPLKEYPNLRCVDVIMSLHLYSHSFVFEIASEYKRRFHAYLSLARRPNLKARIRLTKTNESGEGRIDMRMREWSNIREV